MNQRIPIIVVVLLCFSAFLGTREVLGSKPSAGMPHTISLRLEPDSVSVDASVKVTLTFIPCIDVDSLLIRFRSPNQPGAQVQGPIRQDWRGNAKKGQGINLSSLVVFHRVGTYYVEVFYKHPDPQGLSNPRSGTKVFRIIVPGGIDTTSIRSQLPLHLKRPRTLIGGTGVSPDIPGRVFPVERGGPADSGSPPRWEWRRFEPRDRDTLETRSGGKPLSRDDTLKILQSGKAWPHSVMTGSVSPLTPPCNDTAQIIATCDMLFALYDQYGNVLDASDWRVEPSWLGTIVELGDHRALFTAGSSPGIGNIWCYYGGYNYYMPVMVIANYHLEGSFLYKNRNLSQDLPAKRAEVALYTADPQGNDLVLPIDNKQIHFRFVSGTYTDNSGFYQFDNLNVDSIAVLLLTTYPSHEVGYVYQGYWVLYGWYYSWFGFPCLMHYLAPSVSAGPIVFSDNTRGALNIMSFTQTGVDYVVGLPGSHYPEKVLMWWSPPYPDFTAYFSNLWNIGGQLYDVITVSGVSDDPDQWDQDVFLHEYGHFVMDNYAAWPPEVPNCQNHHWEVPSSPECAYTEGWATFYSCACQNDRIYLDTDSSGSALLRDDAELPTSDPQGIDVEGAVCASLWDIFDDNNDVDAWNRDQNAGLWWQSINEIWWAIAQPGDLGHLPYTVCDFTYIWAWSGYPTDEIWRNIFNAHGIECTPVGVEQELASASGTTPFLWPNRPNPFNPLTQIAFRVARYGRTSVRVCDIGGHVVRTLLDAYKEPGTYTIWWDGKDDSGGFLGSGVYLCRLVVGSFKQTRKLVILR